MSVPAAARGVRILTPLVSAFLALSCLLPEMGVSADAPSPASQKAIIGEVVRVANQYIDHGPCEPSRAEPSTVATMSPYTTDGEAGLYFVVWSGDIGCSGGSGSNTMNYLLIEKRSAAVARIVGAGELDGTTIERIVSATPNSVTVDAYTFGPDDSHCCPSQYERLTYRHEFSVETGVHRLTLVDSKPAEPVPLRAGEKALPTARTDG